MRVSFCFAATPTSPRIMFSPCHLTVLGPYRVYTSSKTAAHVMQTWHFFNFGNNSRGRCTPPPRHEWVNGPWGARAARDTHCVPNIEQTWLTELHRLTNIMNCLLVNQVSRAPGALRCLTGCVLNYSRKRESHIHKLDGCTLGCHYTHRSLHSLLKLINLGTPYIGWLDL